MRVIPAVALALLASSLIAATAPGRTTHYVQAEDHTPAELAQPVSEKTVANCSACHSLDYITTQPRGKGPQFWRDTVTKMVNVYKAPIEPADAEAIATQLGQKFGSAAS